MTLSQKDHYPLVITSVLYVLMIAFGISFTMLGPLMPEILEHYGLTMAGGGSMVSIQNISGLIAVLLCGFFGDRLDKSLFIGLGILLFSLSLLGAGTAPSFGILMALFFVLGLGSRGFDTLANALMSDIHGDRRSLYLNLLHTFFGVGAFLGPMFVYAISRAGVSWANTFVFVGVFSVAVLIGFIIIIYLRRRSGMETDRSTKSEAAEKKGVGMMTLFTQGRMWTLGLVMFLHMGIQGVIITWLPSYVGQTTGAGGFLSGLALSSFWIGIIISRSLISRFSSRFGEIALIRWGTLVSVLTFSGVVAGGGPALIIICTALTGIAVGFTIPFVMSVGCRWYPDKSAAVTSMMFVFGYLSIVVFPWATGLLGDAFGLIAAMILVLGSLVLLFGISWFLPRKEQ